LKKSILIVLGLVLFASGCAGPGSSVIPLDLYAVKPFQKASVPRPEVPSLKTDVAQFEDVRPAPRQLGVLKRAGGAVSYFDVRGGELEPVVSRVVADYLKMKGWNAKVGEGEGADVVLSGKIIDLSVNAERRFLATDIAVKTEIQIEARNTRDGSLVRMTLAGDGSQSVMGYNPEDAEQLLSEILVKNFDKLLADTRVEDGALRLK
jgi:hypothetical protein